jgi:hypothetical protein
MADTKTPIPPHLPQLAVALRRRLGILISGSHLLRFIKAKGLFNGVVALVGFRVAVGDRGLGLLDDYGLHEDPSEFVVPPETKASIAGIG